MTLNLATATFCGKIARIAPANSNYQGHTDEQPWKIWLEVQLQKNKQPVLVHFVTKQAKIPYLINCGRIFVGFEMTVMGQLTSVSIPTQHTDGKQVIHLTKPIIPDEDIYYERTTSYVSSAGRETVVF